MKNIAVLLIPFCALLTGCASFPINSREFTLSPSASGQPKPSLTYTLRWAEGMHDPFAGSNGQGYDLAMQRCTAAFKESGVFSSVKHTKLNQGDVHFDVFLEYSGGNEIAALPSICTFTLIPYFFKEEILLTADLFINGDFLEQNKYKRNVQKIWWAPVFPLQLLGHGMKSCDQEMVRQLCREAVADWQKKAQEKPTP